MKDSACWSNSVIQKKRQSITQFFLFADASTFEILAGHSYPTNNWSIVQEHFALQWVDDLWWTAEVQSQFQFIWCESSPMCMRWWSSTWFCSSRFPVRVLLWRLLVKSMWQNLGQLDAWFSGFLYIFFPCLGCIQLQVNWWFSPEKWFQDFQMICKPGMCRPLWPMATPWCPHFFPHLEATLGSGCHPVWLLVACRHLTLRRINGLQQLNKIKPRSTSMLGVIE